MRDTDIAGPKSLERAATLANKSFDIIFAGAPVMMHSIGKDGKLIKVNHQWLDTMGYQAHEVLGRKSVEFLTNQGQVRTLRDTLPLFWRVGTAKSIGYQFVCKNGRLLDVLLDAEVVNTPGGDSYTVAALYDHESFTKWEEASTTIRVLVQLARLGFDMVKAPLGSEEKLHSEPTSAAVMRSAGGSPSLVSLLGELLGPLLEAALDVSTGLHALVHLHEQWLESTEERQQELLSVAKGIEKTLAELAGLAADKAGPE